MDTARQILRYSIPGSLFLVFGALYFVLWQMALGLEFSEATAPVSTINPGIAIGLSLPIGFLVYQVYYSEYQPFVRFGRLGAALCGERGGRMATTDRGALVLLRFTPRQLRQVLDAFECSFGPAAITDPGRTLGILEKAWPWSRNARLQQRSGRAKPGSNRSAAGMGRILLLGRDSDPEPYERAWRRNWTIVRTLRDLTLTKHSAGLKDEYTALSDLAHALGATRVALRYASVVGTAAALIDIASEPHEVAWAWRLPLAVVGSLVLGAFLWTALYRTRQSSLRAGLASLGWGLSTFLAAHDDVLPAIKGDRRYRWNDETSCWELPENPEQEPPSSAPARGEPADG